MGRDSWRFDKSVNIALVGVILGQFIIAVWWASAYTAKNDAQNARQDDDIHDLKVNIQSLDDMKSDVAVIKSNVAYLTSKLDKVH